MRKAALGFLAAIAFLAQAASAVGQTCPAVAALPDSERRVSYSPSASTGPFSITFPILGDGTDYQNWLEVWLNGVKLTGVTQWTFSLTTGASLATACRPITNGQVTLVTASTGTLQIVGARRPRRTSQFPENAGVSARNLNQVITDLTAEERERWDRDLRTMFVLPGETIGPMPSLATRASKIFGFDAAGDPLAVNQNIGLGTVVGPATSIDGHVAVFNGATGQLIRDGGPAVGTVSSIIAGKNLSGGTITSTGTIALLDNPVLGASGTPGSVTYGNATSGLLTVQPVTGALGTVTLSLPAITDTLVTRNTTDTLTNKTLTSPVINTPDINAGTVDSLTSLSVRSTGAAFDLSFSNGEVLTANRVLTVSVSNANRNLNFGGDVNFGGAFITSANSLTLTTTGATNVTVPTTGTLATLAGAETFTNKILTAPTITGGTASALTGLGIRDTGAAFDLSFVSTNTGISANRAITWDTLNGSRSIALGGSLNFGGSFTTSGANALTFTTTAPTGVTLPTTGTLATLAGAEVLTNKTINGTSNTLTVLASTQLSGTTPVANGGTGQATAAAARTASGLNVESFTGRGDANYTILTTDRVVGTNAAFTGSRTFTLPAANAFNAGQTLIVADFQGTVTVSNTLVIARAGADTINGSTSVTINSANGAFVLISDGTSKWTAQAIGAAAVSGVSSLGGQTGALGVTAPLSMSGTNLTVSLPVSTQQLFITGTGATYTRPSSPAPIYIRVRMVGGGGGGAGSGTTPGATTGGGATTFNALSAAGGSGASTVFGGAGGALAGTGSQGGDGNAALNAAQSMGGQGGGSVFGSGGQAGPNGPSVGNPGGPYGSGGGGAGCAATTGAGGGGGSGAYRELLITAPASTYTYTVGAGGTGGSAGTSGAAGGAGKVGIIIVDEFYQ